MNTLGIANTLNLKPNEIVDLAQSFNIPIPPIEICPTFISPWNKEVFTYYNNFLEYQKQCEALNVKIRGVQSILYGLNWQLTAAIKTLDDDLHEHFIKLRAICVLLKANYIIVGCPQNRKIVKNNLSSIYHFSNNINTLAEYIFGSDITILIEPVFDQDIVFYDYSAAFELVDYLDRPNVKLLFDTYSFGARYEQYNLIRKYKDLIGFVHINTTKSELQAHDQYAKLLKEIGYNGPMSLEHQGVTNFKETYKWALELYAS